ncbi:hypothetical protein [Roseateles asaccharophilus]|uniref:Alkylhydroperoxidase family enzyme n=1 Tax=Roseateles asaccharophilus TaxID=582607 RepID=A0ABU2AHA3_9BURK|nr:hypothetical protein [Roseateles asaccharophilus]MDR7335832.1 alkylhydroperoxidase family enzyme [Roseateles asaccharophilus]
MNLTQAWAWRPDIYDDFAALRTQLSGASALSKRELAVMVCAGASELRDAYCSLAWGRTLAKDGGAPLAAAILQGNVEADATPRELALARWARRVVADPNATTAADVQALRDAGLGGREIFEATVWVAFRQAFSTVNAALGVAPDAQLAAAAPTEVRAAVDYGRPPA